MLSFFKALGLCSIFLLSAVSHAVPENVTLRSDIAYGPHEKQKLDVYSPAGAEDAPVIFMIHGGAWRGGDKARPEETDLKVAHWVPKGFVYISTNYRLLPEMDPVGQARDVAAAIAFAQKNAAKWGGNADKFILMGHSAGAHLVSLVAADHKNLSGGKMQPWLGTVSLDISNYDLPSRVSGENPSEFYLEIFGNDPTYWQKASPYHTLTEQMPPFYAVCTTQNEFACPQSELFVKKAKSFGGKGGVLAVGLGHMEINWEFGKNADYTAAVDMLLKAIDPEVEGLLEN